MQTVLVSEPTAARRRVYFTCVDTTALQTRLAATDMSTFTVRLSKNGAATAAATNAPVEVDVTNAKGVFYIEMTASEVDTRGILVIVITNAGGTKVMEKREIPVVISGTSPY